MKGKLIKVEDGYNLLMEQPQGRLLEATCSISELKRLEENNVSVKKLSKQNCDQIFGVKSIIATPLNEYIKERRSQEECIGFINGFEKAMELNKDKLFTVGDMHDAVMLGVCFENTGIQGISNYNEAKDLAIKRALKPTEIDVEIEMVEPHQYEMCSNPKDHSSCLTPKLDENNCLILKRI